MLHQRETEWVLLQANLPGQQALTIGVFVRDLTDGQLFCRFASKWWHQQEIDREDAEYFEALMAELEEKAENEGDSLLSVLESATNSITITEPQCMQVADCVQALEELYDLHVELLGERKNVGGNNSENLKHPRSTIRRLSWLSGLAVAAGLVCTTLFRLQAPQSMEVVSPVRIATAYLRQPIPIEVHERFLALSFDEAFQQSSKRLRSQVSSGKKKARFALGANDVLFRPANVRRVVFPQAPMIEYAMLESSIPQILFEQTPPPPFRPKRTLKRFFRTLAKPLLWVVQ
jgi:hypothetical protein